MRKQFYEQQKRNNEGFTLVELLISVMILAVVSTAVFAFMKVGAGIFNRSNLEVEMQKEAQIMKNYMNDLITDTTRGMEFKKSTQEGTNIYGADSCLMIYGEDTVAYLGWIKEAEEIRYLEKQKDSFWVDESGTYHVSMEGEEGNAKNWPLMAKYVKQFDCYLENLKKEHRIFSAELGFSLQHLSYNTTHTITLRNDIFYEGRSEEPYEEVMGGYKEQITRITLTPGNIDKAIDRVHGTTIEFAATVLAVGDIDTGVLYEVEGNTSSQTEMRDAVLYIAPDEKSPVLTVICKAKVDPDISTTAVVNIASVSAVTITAKQEPMYKDLYYYAKSVIDFEAKVEGNFATREGKNVTWELVDDKDSAYIMESSATTCRIHTGDNKNQVLKLRAISQVDPNVMTEYEIFVADIEVGEFYITAENGDYTVCRGNTLKLEVLKEGQKVQDGVHWRIVDNPLNNKLSIDSQGRLSAGMDIDFDKSYQIKVEAAVTETDHTVNTVTCAVTIDKVEITMEPSYVVLVAKAGGNPSRVKVNIKGIDMRDGDLMVQQYPYVRGLEIWVASQEKESGVLGINMPSLTEEDLANGFTGYTGLKVSLKGYSNIYEMIPVYFYKYNLGTNLYAPVPGDGLSLIKDENADGIVDTSSTVTIDGVTYGYTYVNVNGTLFHYYTNASQNPKWFVKVGNEAAKYVYNREAKRYETLP